MAGDLIQREQYMDFVRNRDFRKTLLCHREVKIDRELRPDSLGKFHVAAPLACVDRSIDLRDANPMKFQHILSNQELLATTPLWKGALHCLAEAWPGSVPFGKIASMARAAAGLEQITDAENLYKEKCLLGKSLLPMHLSGLAEIHSAPPRFLREVKRSAGCQPPGAGPGGLGQPCNQPSPRGCCGGCPPAASRPPTPGRPPTLGWPPVPGWPPRPGWPPAPGWPPTAGAPAPPAVPEDTPIPPPPPPEDPFALLQAAPRQARATKEQTNWREIGMTSLRLSPTSRRSAHVPYAGRC